MGKDISLPFDSSGLSPAIMWHGDRKLATWISRRVTAFLTAATASVLWVIAWMLARSD